MGWIDNILVSSSSNISGFWRLFEFLWFKDLSNVSKVLMSLTVPNKALRYVCWLDWLVVRDGKTCQLCSHFCSTSIALFSSFIYIGFSYKVSSRERFVALTIKNNSLDGWFLRWTCGSRWSVIICDGNPQLRVIKIPTSSRCQCS